MSDYTDVWDEAYYAALDRGEPEQVAESRGYAAAQEWSERHMAKAEAMEDR